MVHGWYRHIDPPRMKKFFLDKLKYGSSYEKIYSALGLARASEAIDALNDFCENGKRELEIRVRRKRRLKFPQLRG